MLKNVAFSSKSILKSEFLELIEFDKIHFYQSMKNINLPDDELPPFLTEVDIEKGSSRGVDTLIMGKNTYMLCHYPVNIFYE